jgi:Acetyltransferase (GNAT) domain
VTPPLPDEPTEPRTAAGPRHRAPPRSGGVPQAERAPERPLERGLPATVRQGGALTWLVRRSDLDELWRDVSRDAEGATFFHTPEWAAVCEEVFGAWRRAPLAVEFSDGNVALLPFVRRARPFAALGHHESMLPGVYGGPLFLHEPGEAHWRAVWEAVDALPGVFLYGNPFRPWSGGPRGERALETTRALDLAPGFDAVFRRFRYSYRSGIRAAAKRGFEAAPATSHDDVERYDRIYRDSLRRWGKGARGFYPRRLFHALFELGRSAPVRLWLVRKDGVPVGGAWVLEHNEHADYWHASVDSGAMIHYPMHLLVATAVEDACARGFRWFDFNPSGGLEGVELFKRGFHPQELAFPVYGRFPAPVAAYRTYRRILEKRLGRCPL